MQLIGARYRVERELGSGGMGTVYLCRDEQSGGQAAVKLMHPQFAQRKDYVARFRRESEIACRLNHPNIVRGLGFGTEAGVPYLAMDVLTGKSLGELMFEDGRRFDPPSALAIVAQAAAGLSALVTTGKVIAHRDLSSANIFLESDGSVKVGDFGIAKVDDSGETRTGLFLGNVRYMSPEQINDPKRLDVRSDIYMLGVVLYELLTGQHLFEGSPHEIANQHLYSEPPIPHIGGPGAEACKSVLHRCLAKSPEDRYDSPQAMVAAIRESGFGAATGAMTIKTIRRRGGISPAVAVGLVAIAVVALVVVLAQPEKPGPLSTPLGVTSANATPAVNASHAVNLTSVGFDLVVSPTTVSGSTSKLRITGRGPTQATYALLNCAILGINNKKFGPGDPGWSGGALDYRVTPKLAPGAAKSATLLLRYFENDPATTGTVALGSATAPIAISRARGTRVQGSGVVSAGSGDTAGDVVMP